MKYSILLSSVFLIIFSNFCNAAVWTIVYPQSEVENDIRYEFPVALLDLALQKTGVRYELMPSSGELRQARAVKKLEENLEINVMWSMTDLQREQQLRPIRIPITRGLIGLRVLVSHKQHEFLQRPIKSIDDLLSFSPVQGISWPDTKILQANGFNVITAQDFLEAVSLIENNLADFFPRSVIEVFGELEQDFAANFEIKKDVYISYPTALYFFTNKQNLTLSKLIETGLLRAIEDGSYQALFDEFFNDVLTKLNVDKALTFQLVNPLLPQMTPIGKPEYWYFPPLVDVPPIKKALNQ